MFKNIFQGLFKIFKKIESQCTYVLLRAKYFIKISERKNKQNLKETNQGNNLTGKNEYKCLGN